MDGENAEGKRNFLSLLGESLIYSESSISQASEEHFVQDNIETSILSCQENSQLYSSEVNKALDYNCFSQPEMYSSSIPDSKDYYDWADINMKSVPKLHSGNFSLKSIEAQGNLATLRNGHDLAYCYSNSNFPHIVPNNAYSYAPVLHNKNQYPPSINCFANYSIPDYRNFGQNLYLSTNYNSAYQLNRQQGPSYIIPSPSACIMQPIFSKLQDVSIFSRAKIKHSSNSTSCIVKSLNKTTHNKKKNTEYSEVPVKGKNTNKNAQDLLRFKEQSKANKKSHPKLQSESKDATLENSEFMNLNLIDYLCTQKGCRYFQRNIYNASPIVIDELIQKIGNNFHIIMTDLYANYFFQKLLSCCSQPQRIAILNFISTKFHFISNNSSGTHAIQKLYDLISSPEEILLISNGLYADFIQICKVN